MGKFGQARGDGRPQYYDIGPQQKVQCHVCVKSGRIAWYKQYEAVINDPANSPEDDDGGVYTICVRHTPNDAVICDPNANYDCRTKDGQTTWNEERKQ